MKLSKNNLALAIVGAAAIGVAGLGVAGIADTKHNLGSDNAVNDNYVSGGGANTEICVFCHTPHGSDTSAPVPLWNKKLDLANTTYQTYDQLGTSSLDGSVASVGSVSLACLSCHDGTQAMDNIINAPGSGGYDAFGGDTENLAGGLIGRNTASWAWTSVSTVDADGKMQLNGGDNSPFPMLGTDLRNDHPVGIAYCGGYLSGDASGTCQDGDFTTPKTASVNGGDVYWIDTPAGTANSRQSTDLQLYTRLSTDTGVTVTDAYVECASCHDPHSENATFLRVPNTNSDVCLACHTK